MSSKKRRKHEKEDEERGKEVASDENEASADNSDSDDSVDDAESNVDSDDSDHTNFINKEMQIEFCAHQPIDDDFNGIRVLLSQLWLKERIDLSELTQLLIKQKFICSVITQSNDESSSEDEEKSDSNSDSNSDAEDVFGVTSVVSLSDNNETVCVQQIKNVLLSHIPKDNKVYQFITDNWQNIGLMVNERFANIPPKISLPSYQQLLSDIKEAKDSKTNKLKLEFSSYLMIVKLVKTKSTKPPISIDGDNSNELIYINAEDEIFDELSEHRFEYSVANQRDNDVLSGDWSDEHLFEPYRKVLIISAKNWLKAIDKLKDEFQ